EPAATRMIGSYLGFSLGRRAPLRRRISAGYPCNSVVLRRGFFVLAVALLVLLARAARARIVAADLRAVAADRLGLRVATVGSARRLRGAAAPAATLGGHLPLLARIALGLVLRLAGDALLDHLALLLLERGDLLLFLLDLDREQLVRGVRRHAIHHLGEQVEADPLVLLLRILLAVAL